MKKIYSFINILLAALLVASCQDEETATDAVGYLRLEVGTTAYVNPQTKTIIDEYNPKQIAIQIVDESNAVVEETDDWETWEGKQIRLKPGNYTVKASSNGFDGNNSGFDIPYYTGSTSISIATGKEVTAQITCTLANVKVTVNFDASFVSTFRSARSVVSSAVAGIDPLTFVMGETTQSGYFPVGNLTAAISVVNQAGNEHSMSTTIEDVKARDHYILNYKVAESGNGSIKVEADDSEKTYTFTFNVSTEAATKLAMDNVNAWSNFAYVTGSIASSKEELDAAAMKFEYRPKAGDAAWTQVAATQEGEAFKATLTGLTANTEYECRMSYQKEGDTFASEVSTFTTEAATELINGNMDDWYKSDKTWYPTSEAYFTANNNKSFWDSSNPGTTTGLGALVNINPTQGNSETVHTPGGKSAELKSQEANAFSIKKFAAASLYTGSFNSLVGANGAKIDFGQPFTSRPTQLHGWFQYSTGAITHVGNNTPADANIVQGETLDVCAIYIALATKPYTVDNTNTETFIDFDSDPDIIAYGTLSPEESVPTNGQWKEFNINLEYRDLETKPTHIIIVCSASKYGDYFTGSTSSVMYVDDMELIYGNEPTIKK